MNSYKKLFDNSIIFAIGTMGSRVISILLVPLYTYYLTTEEYGEVDLVATTVSMLLPLVSLSMHDAVMRFVMDKTQTNNKIVTNSFFVLIVGILLLILLLPMVYIMGVQKYLNYLALILICQILERYLAQYARGLGEYKVFAFNGILLTFLTGSLNIFFLVYLEKGVPGYFISQILALIISIIYLTMKTKIIKAFSFEFIKLQTIKELLKYSVPMIPNSLMWWVINASSRYFITFYIGLSANGLFAVASRIPTLLTFFSQIFTQAWQLSAIEEYDSTKKDNNFYSNIFNLYSTMLFLGSSLIIIFIKYIFYFLFDNSFYDGWMVTPFLLLGAVFSALSSFIGATYIASKQTTGVLKTSIYGGIVSLILYFVLIPRLEIVGAGLSSYISFVIIFFIRYKDTMKLNKFYINFKVFYLNIFVVNIQIILLFLGLESRIELLLGILFFLSLLLINRKFFLLLVNYLKIIIDNRKQNKNS